MNVPAFLLGRQAALTAAAIAGGAVLLLVAGLFTLAFSVVTGSRQDSLDQLAALESRANDIPVLTRALKTERLQTRSLASLLQGESEANAQAVLQHEIKSIVEQAGGEVRTSLILPTEQSQGLSAIAVQYELSLPVNKLRDLTYAIETHVPYFFISDATISAPQFWPTDANAPAPQIEVRWTVRAYRSDGAL